MQRGGIVALACLFLSGCVEKVPGATTDLQQSIDPLRPGDLASGVSLVPSVSYSQSKVLIKEGGVVCTEGQVCPSSVGMVATPSPQGVGLCTGFLLGSDLLVTSSSCIPSDLKNGLNARVERSLVPCSGRLTVFFPADSTTQLPAESRGCSEILGVTEEDVAFVRLSSSLGRKPYPISFEGLAEGLKIQMPYLTPLSEVKVLAELRVSECISIQGSLVLPSFDHPLRSQVVVAGCPAGNAASGAPLLDQGGNIRAVVRSPYRHEALIQSTFKALLGETEVAEFTQAANWACQQFPASLPQRRLPSECSPSITSAPVGVLDDWVERANQDALGRLSQWQLTHGGVILKWKLPVLTQSQTSDVVPLPDCFLDPQGWLQQYKHWYWAGGYEASTNFILILPRYRSSLLMNSFTQLSYRVDALPDLDVLVSFSPREIAEGEQSTLDVRMLSSQGRPGATLYAPKVIHRCNSTSSSL